MQIKIAVIGFLVIATTTVLAHQGVKNQAVLARMDSMSAMAAATKILVTMAKGTVSFDAQIAQHAAATIAKHASDTPALYETKEEDPKSEARPDIWTNFEDFKAKAQSLEDMAAGYAQSISDVGQLNAAIVRFGAACKACHSTYRN